MVAVIFHLSAGCISYLVLSTAAYSPHKKGKESSLQIFLASGEKAATCKVFKATSVCVHPPISFRFVSFTVAPSGGKWIYVPSQKFGAKIVKDICPWTLSVPRSEQFFRTDNVQEQVCKHIFAPNRD